MRIIVYLLFCALLFQPTYNFGQGCSDAGFCSINSFKPQSEDSLQKNIQIKLGMSYGSADHDITVFGSVVELSYKHNEKISFDLRSSLLTQKGNLVPGSTFGIDMLLALNYSPNHKSKFTLGVKLPGTDGNIKEEGQPLPMDYQPSLGTIDLIAGGGFTYDRWQFHAAIQQPLKQNKNAFLAEVYPANSVFREFHSTNQFIRSGDVLLRVTYSLLNGKKFSVTPSLLPIFHLNNDKYTDLSGGVREIEGSQGLTFNGNIFIDYKFNDKNSIQLGAGAPFIVRDARPDGLTRHFIITLEYKLNIDFKVNNIYHTK